MSERSYLEQLYSRVSFFDIAFMNGKGWFCDVYTNALYTVDVETGEIRLENMIPYYRESVFFQYGFIGQCGDVLVLAPRSSDRVILYDTEEKTFVEIPLRMDSLEKDGIFNLFSGVVIYEEYAYLIPGRYPAIVKIDLETKEVTYIDSWYQALRKKLANFDVNKVMFARCRCLMKDRLYLPCWQGKYVMVFDLEAETYQLAELAFTKDELSCIAADGADYFIGTKESRIIWRCDDKWDVKEELPIETAAGKGVNFLAVSGNRLFIELLQDARLMEIDLRKRECSVLYEFPTEPKDMPDELIFARNNILSCVCDAENNYWLYSIYDGKIVKISDNPRHIAVYDAVLDSEEKIKRKVVFSLNSLPDNGFFCVEDAIYGLADFCGRVVGKKNERGIS